MSVHHHRDGRVTTFTGRSTCVCTKCDEVFNSVAAFDAHLTRGKNSPEPAKHDWSWMPRNARGLLVTSLREMGEDE